MSPTGEEHNGVVYQLLSHFRSLGPYEVIIGVQGAIQLEDSEPQPDLALLKFRPDFYRRGHTGPEDVLLLIEVADSSIDSDQRVKIPLYAKAGIAEVWIVDLNAKLLRVYRGPVDGGYQAVQALGGTDQIAPLAFEDRTIKLDVLFPIEIESASNTAGRGKTPGLEAVNRLLGNPRF